MTTDAGAGGGGGGEVLILCVAAVAAQPKNRDAAAACTGNLQSIADRRASFLPLSNRVASFFAQFFTFKVSFASF